MWHNNVHYISIFLFWALLFNYMQAFIIVSTCTSLQNNFICRASSNDPHTQLSGLLSHWVRSDPQASWEKLASAISKITKYGVGTARRVRIKAGIIKEGSNILQECLFTSRLTVYCKSCSWYCCVSHKLLLLFRIHTMYKSNCAEVSRNSSLPLHRCSLSLHGEKWAHLLGAKERATGAEPHWQGGEVPAVAAGGRWQNTAEVHHLSQEFCQWNKQAQTSGLNPWEGTGSAGPKWFWYVIRESVDSLCRDGAGPPIVRVHLKSF